MNPPDPKARASDIAVGLSKAMKGWIFGAGFVAFLVVGLLVGANLPADPTFVEAGAPQERRILIGAQCLRVEVADTPAERAQGLKDRDSLGDYDGMIFVWDSMGDRAFTMQGTRIPLTVGFYDTAGAFVDKKDMKPCPQGGGDCPTYGSKGPFQYAVEVAQGKLPAGTLVQRCPA